MKTALRVFDDTAIREMIGRKIRSKVSSCQRILLINPQQIPEQDFLIERALHNRYWSYQPYGCGVLARNLEGRGYVADILDLNFEMLKLAHTLKESFSYSMWQVTLLSKLVSFNPDLVCISSMFTMSHEIMKDIARLTKEYRHELTVIAGGVHPTNARELVLEDCPHIDFIGTYESDRSFPDLVDFINEKLDCDGLSQIATLIDGAYIAIDSRATPTALEIDAAPLYKDLPIGEYDEVGQIGSYVFYRKGRTAASILSERGCRAHCSFCSVADFNGPGVRERSVKSFLDEVESLITNYGIKHLTLLDDDFLHNKKRVMELLQSFIDRKFDITWDASNGLIAAFITPEIMEMMVASGCIGFNLGIESGNSEILRAVHKPGTVSNFRKCKEVVDQYPQVFVKGFLMLGFPNETLGQILDTVKLSLELDLDWYSIQLLNPLPSTEIYYTMIQQGLIQDNLETSNVAYVFGPHGRQRLREEREKIAAADFFNLFNVCDINAVPEKKQLGDYWFLMDYKLNYEPVLGLTDPLKIRKRELMLREVCDRIAPENPMGHVFHGIIMQRQENLPEAKRRARLAANILRDSDYWRKRFDALELNGLLESLV